MSLILDHVNGVPNDNRIDNLRIVCPNCAATLATHCGRKNRLLDRECVLCGKLFRPRQAQQRYCSPECGTRHKTRRRAPKPSLRKVPRPSYDQLMSDVRSGSLLAASRKYGVSDNAIRKWIRWYEDQTDDERGLSDQGVPAERMPHEPGAVRSDAELAAGRIRLPVAPPAGSPTISP